MKRIATLQDKPLKLQVRPLSDEAFDPETDDMRAKSQQLVTSLKKLFEQQPLYIEQIRHVSSIDFQARTSHPRTHTPKGFDQEHAAVGLWQSHNTQSLTAREGRLDGPVGRA